MKAHNLYLLSILFALLASCSRKPVTPEEVVKEYEYLMSQGDCENAMKLTTGYASESIQASIDAGCNPYDTVVDSVICEINGDEGKCLSYETRETWGSFAWPIYVAKVDGEWKVSNTTKSTGLDKESIENAE